MKKVVIYFLLSAVLLPCCGRQEGNVAFVRDFPETGEIEYKAVDYDPTVMDLDGVSYAGDGLWVVSLYKSEKAFAVLDGDLKELVRFGRMGRGPGELNTPRFVRMESLRGDSATFLIRDWFIGRLYRMTVSLEDGGLSYGVRDFGESLRALYPLPDGRWLINRESNRYFILESDGSRRYFEGWGEDINEVLESSETYIPDNQTSEFFNADTTVMIAYSIRYPVLYKHSIDGRLLKKVYVRENASELREQDGYYTYFTAGAYVGDNVVLLFCDGRTETSELMVFDGQLEPVISYQIPYTDDMAVNRDTGGAVAISFDDEKLYIFDLSRWL
jgi:hypothetical protein